VIRHLFAPVVPRFAADLGVPTTSRVADGVSLTFDDGPHDDGTPAVLDVLARAGALATFFVVGEQVERRPHLLERIVADGHRVGLHGYRHRVQLRLTPAQVRADLERGAAVIAAVTGESPRWHRPPLGLYSPAGLAWVREAGMSPLLWSHWGKDWRRWTTPERIAARVLDGLGPGDVILLHDADFYSARDSHTRTVPALRLIMNTLTAQKVATVLPV
jgi:peptidoglycan/xylan/chitin deacetylase (PgdA/CDA1 family)